MLFEETTNDKSYSSKKQGIRQINSPTIRQCQYKMLYLQMDYLKPLI